MNAIATIAGREIRDGLRNRWALGAVLLMAGLALTLAFLGSAPTGVVGASPLEVTVVSLSSLTIFLVPLIFFSCPIRSRAGRSSLASSSGTSRSSR